MKIRYPKGSGSSSLDHHHNKRGRLGCEMLKDYVNARDAVLTSQINERRAKVNLLLTAPLTSMEREWNRQRGERE